MTKPITPTEVGKVKETKFPDFVIEAFNECITRHWDGKIAKFTQDAVLTEIVARGNTEGGLISRTYVFEQRWLDIESLFEQYGWRVEYDRPGYNEMYEPTFLFKRPTRGV